MEDAVWVLIPLMALAIPLTAVAGRVVVKPIVDAIMKLTATQAQPPTGTPVDERLLRTEERLANVERLLERVIAEQDFQRELLSGRRLETALPDAESERPAG